MTQRIPKVAKADSFFPAYSYMVVRSDGMYVSNGQVSIKYGPEKIGKVFSDIANECGGLALPNPEQFMRIVATFSKDEAVVNLDKDNAVLELQGGYDSETKTYRTRMVLPVVYPLVPEDLPQLQVDYMGWTSVEEEPSKKNPYIPVDSRWQNFKELVTREGEAVWKGSIGVYCRGGLLFSFDSDLLVVCPDKYEFMPDFFLPREFVDLGFFGLARLVVAEDRKVHLVGPGIECVVQAEPVMDVYGDMLQIEERFKEGRKYPVSINTTSHAWDRARAINDPYVWLTFKDKRVYLSRKAQTHWNEEIGGSTAPNAKYRARTSLILRWAQKTTGHSVVMDEEGVCYLHGKTRAGMEMYIVITPNSPMTDPPEEVLQEVQEDSPEETEEATVLI